MFHLNFRQKDQLKFVRHQHTIVETDIVEQCNSVKLTNLRRRRNIRLLRMSDSKFTEPMHNIKMPLLLALRQLVTLIKKEMSLVTFKNGVLKGTKFTILRAFSIETVTSMYPKSPLDWALCKADCYSCGNLVSTTSVHRLWTEFKRNCRCHCHELFWHGWTILQISCTTLKD